MFNKKTKRHVTRRLFGIFNAAVLIFLCAAVVIPILRTVCYSFYNYRMYGLNFFDSNPTLISYRYLFRNEYVLKRLAVSLITTAAVTVTGLTISSISAYILMQRKMPGAKLFGYFILFTLIFDAGLIPRFLFIYKKINLLNSLWAIIIPLSLNTANIFILREYFERIPKSYFEAAELDGCSALEIFFKILLPMSKAPLFAVGVFFAAAAWNEYIGYVMYITDNEKYNWQYYIRETVAYYFRRYDVTCQFVNAETIMGAAVFIGILPAFFITPLMQRFFVPTILSAGIKE